MQTLFLCKHEIGKEIMKRIAIFSIFCSNGVIEDYIWYLLHELRNISNILCVVINGNVDERGKKKILLETDHFLIRENKG